MEERRAKEKESEKHNAGALWGSWSFYLDSTLPLPKCFNLSDDSGVNNDVCK